MYGVVATESKLKTKRAMPSSLYQCVRIKKKIVTKEKQEPWHTYSEVRRETDQVLGDHPALPASLRIQFEKQHDL
jgi:hypothetical protein